LPANQRRDSRILTALVAPLREWGPRARLIALSTAVAVGTGLAAMQAYTFLLRDGPFFDIADARYYVFMAKGDMAHTVQPFASRQLQPLTVRALAHVLHWSVQQAFLLEGWVLLPLTLAMSLWLVRRTAAPRWFFAAVALMPMWGWLFHTLALPDLWYMTMTLAMLALLKRGQTLAAALMMFPLMLSRESTSLTLVCLLIAAWKPLRWRGRIAAVAAAMAGSAAVGLLVRHTGANMEHLPQMFYLLAKVPWNFLRNVLGVNPWSNLYPYSCAVPKWQMAVAIGPLRAVGTCGFSLDWHREAIEVLLSHFGLMPLLLAFLWWRHRHQAGRSVYLRFVLLYGAIAFVLAPVLGTSYLRLIGYSWPLFLLGTPELMSEKFEGPPRGQRAWAAVGFFAIHAAICVNTYGLLPRAGWIPELVLWLVAYWLLRVWWGPAEAPEIHPLAW